MPYILTIVGYPPAIPLPQDNYDNCHEFTKAAICALSASPNHQLSPMMQRYLVHLTDGVAARDVYINMVEQGNTTWFNQNTCANIPAGHLILFCTQGNIVDVSHSMMTTNADEWTGANNISSLGDVPDIFVHSAQNISGRVHNQGVMGGWHNNAFHGVVDDHSHQYIMHHIPIL